MLSRHTWGSVRACLAAVGITVLTDAPDGQRPLGVRDRGRYRYRCRCGMEFGERTCLNAILTGNTTSCGCYSRQKSREVGLSRGKDIEPGVRSGCLVVVRQGPHIGTNRSFWCKCDCGQETLATGTSIRKGIRKSCGCLLAKTAAANGASVAIHISSGDRYGRLVVKNCTQNLGLHRAYLCSCDCGNETTVRAGDLNSGNTKSCGCLRSMPEVEMFQFVYSLAPDAVGNDRSVFPPKFPDIHVPSKNLVVELFGQHWHGEVFLESRGRTECLDRLNLIHGSGKRGLIFFENEWVNRRGAVEGFIQSALGLKPKVGARECRLVEVPNVEVVSFLDRHHILGSVKKVGVSLGLKFEDELVAVATFVKANPQKAGGEDGVFELTRYCLGPRSVVGGVSKLIKAFWVATPAARTLISYSDNRLSEGRLYENSGFKKDRVSHPSYWYFNGKDLELKHRFNFRRDALMKKGWLREGDTEWTCMRRHGWDRIWDAGKVRWELSRPLVNSLDI
jgi:hypothetical protein